MGKRTVGDVLSDAVKHPSTLIPFVAPVSEALKTNKYIAAYERLQADQYTDPNQKLQDEDFVNRTANDAQRQAARGTTTAGRIAETVIGSLVFAGEFLTLNRVFNTGKASTAKIAGLLPEDFEAKVSLEAARRAATGLKGLEAAPATVARDLALAEANRSFGTKLLTSAGGAAAMMPFMQPRVMADLFSRMAPTVQYDETTGDATLVKEQKDMVKEFLKAEGSTFADVWSERFGEIMFDPLAAKVSKSLAKMVNTLLSQKPLPTTPSPESLVLQASSLCVVMTCWVKSRPTWVSAG
jgi:hypothetical protein